MSKRTPRRTCKLCEKHRDGTHVSYCRQCYNAYKRRFYVEHREREIERSKAYNKANPHVPARNMRAVRSRAGKGVYAAKYRAYRELHRDQFRANYAKAKAKRRKALLLGEGFAGSDWKLLKQTFRNECAYCGSSASLTIDHVTPLTAGGKHEASNIVPACTRCNCSKNNRPVQVFLAMLIAQERDGL